MEKTKANDYDPKKSIEILRYVEGRCVDEIEAVAYLAVCLVSLSPDLETTLDLVRLIESQRDQETN